MKTLSEENFKKLSSDVRIIVHPYDPGNIGIKGAIVKNKGDGCKYVVMPLEEQLRTLSNSQIKANMNGISDKIRIKIYRKVLKERMGSLHYKG